jgi:hypothetical protein
MKNFTPEDLIQYLYEETSPEMTADIKAALEADWTLREKFEVIKTSAARLDRIIESPRAEVLQRVLDYAKSAGTVVHHS